MGDSLQARYSLTTAAQQHGAGMSGSQSHAAAAAAAAAAQAALSAIRLSPQHFSGTSSAPASSSEHKPLAKGTAMHSPVTSPTKHHHRHGTRHRPAPATPVREQKQVHTSSSVGSTPASKTGTHSSTHRQSEGTAASSMLQSPISRSSSAWSMSSDDEDDEHHQGPSTSRAMGGSSRVATNTSSTVPPQIQFLNQQADSDAGPVMVVNGMAVDARGRRFSEFLTARLDDVPYFKGFLGRRNLLVIARDGRLADTKAALLDQVPDVPGDYLWLLRAPDSDAEVPVFLGKAGGNNNGTLRRRFDEYLNPNGTFGPLTDPHRFWPLQDALSRGFTLSIRFLKGLKRGRPTAKLGLANYNFPLNAEDPGPPATPAAPTPATAATPTAAVGAGAEAAGAEGAGAEGAGVNGQHMSSPHHHHHHQATQQATHQQPHRQQPLQHQQGTRAIMFSDGRCLDDFQVCYPRLQAYSQSFRFQLAFDNNQLEETAAETGMRPAWSWPAPASISGTCHDLGVAASDGTAEAAATTSVQALQGSRAVEAVGPLTTVTGHAVGVVQAAGLQPSITPPPPPPPQPVSTPAPATRSQQQQQHPEVGEEDELPDGAAWFGLIAVLVNAVSAAPVTPAPAAAPTAAAGALRPGAVLYHDWDVKHKNPLFMSEGEGRRCWGWGLAQGCEAQVEG